MTDDPHAGQSVRRAGVPLSEAAAAVVLLHGRGDTADGILGLASFFGRDDLAILAPQASGLAWYPQSFLAPLASNEPYLSSALRAVVRLVEEAEQAGFPPERIAIGGFSQGACLALETAARHARRWGLVFGLSGGLIGTDEQTGAAPSLLGMGGRYADKSFDYAGRLDDVPVLLRCSDVDPHIPLARVERTAEVFRSLGAAVDIGITPGGAHTVERESLDALRNHLAAL